jgi:hypothetical protein
VVASKEMGLPDFVTGAAHSTGKDIEQKSHRAECFRIMGVILLGNRLLKMWGVNVGRPNHTNSSKHNRENDKPP